VATKAEERRKETAELGKLGFSTNQWAGLEGVGSLAAHSLLVAPWLAPLLQGRGGKGAGGSKSPGGGGKDSAQQTAAREQAQSMFGLSSSEWAGLSAADKSQLVKDAKVQGPSAASIEKQIASDPWSQLQSALVDQYKSAQAPVSAAVSGLSGPTAEAAAGNQALASLGLSPSSAAGSWLSSQMAAANATDQPLTQAMNAYGNAYNAQAQPVESALTNLGQANAMAVATAPEQSWLSALGSHVTSNLSYYGAIPNASIAGLPAPLVSALQQSGGYGGSMAGLTPLQSLTPNLETGGVSAPAKTSATTAATGILGGGTVPTANSAAPGQ
jgi:hypothetical protein